MQINRRRAMCLGAVAPLAPLTVPAWATAQADPGGEVLHIATAWRVAGVAGGPGSAAPDGGDRIGVLRVDWNAGRVQPLWSLPVPSCAPLLASSYTSAGAIGSSSLRPSVSRAMPPTATINVPLSMPGPRSSWCGSGPPAENCATRASVCGWRTLIQPAPVCGSVSVV